MYFGVIPAAMASVQTRPVEPDEIAMFFMSATAWMMAIAFGSMLVRWVGSPLGVMRRYTAHVTSPTTMQWTVRQMMTATAAYAVVFALSRVARALPGVTAIIYVPTVVLLAVSLVWATLGLGNLGWRALVALTGIALLSTTFGYAVGGPDILDQIVRGSLLFGPMCLLMAASLLVIRSCGYRLVPLAKTDRADA